MKYRAAAGIFAEVRDRIVEHGAMEVEGERHFAALTFCRNLGRQRAGQTDIAFMTEDDTVPDSQPFRGPGQRLPAAGGL